MALYRKALCFVFVLSFIFQFHETSEVATDNPSQEMMSRKLITISGKQDSEINQKSEIQTERIRTDACSKDVVVVYQGSTAPLPSGVPTYTVQILNKCILGCAVSNIHLSCGWFSSARLVNPSVFRRLGYDDCLVNNGGSLGPGESLSFVYANTYRYQLGVTSVVCNS